MGSKYYCGIEGHVVSTLLYYFGRVSVMEYDHQQSARSYQSFLVSGYSCSSGWRGWNRKSRAPAYDQKCGGISAVHRSAWIVVTKDISPPMLIISVLYSKSHLCSPSYIFAATLLEMPFSLTSRSLLWRNKVSTKLPLRTARTKLNIAHLVPVFHAA